MNYEEAGLDAKALQRYIEEQIYTLPGTTEHRDKFTVLLTGSRATGAFRHDSDVDIDVLCSADVYRAVQQASLDAGIIRSRSSFLCPSPTTREDWGCYFGNDKGAPHFSLNTLESVRDQFAACEDPAVWIWTTAKVISDPDGRFQTIRNEFPGYTQDVLVRKLKYHWLSCWYSIIDVFPGRHQIDDNLLVAATALLNGIVEMQKVFLLVEGIPLPYTEKLPFYAGQTKLGRRFGPLLKRWVDLILGQTSSDLPAWDRLNAACDDIMDDQDRPETAALEEAVVAAMIAAGVEKVWMENYYSNMGELLHGELGPAP
jgi:hypothetical protein